MAELTQFTRCRRCGVLGRSGTGNPDSRPFHRAVEGLCVNCAVTEFLKSLEVLDGMTSLPQALLLPHVQQQFANIMVAGHCDASPSEINWQAVVDQWDLPMPRKRRKAL